MTLELPTDLQSQVEELAAQRGTDAQTVVIEATRAGIGATNGTRPETREARRARISAAIDEAQRHFAPLLHGGDAVSQLMAEGRADGERAAERGL